LSLPLSAPEDPEAITVIFKVKVLDKLVNADELFRSISQTKAN